MEEQKLDFSLPQGKRAGNHSFIFLILLCVAITVLLAFDFYYIKIIAKQTVSTVTVAGFSAKQTEELAAKLAQRNLYDQAAKVWKEYLAQEKLTEAERAKVLFNTAALLEKAQNYAEAVEYYYRSELTANRPELESSIKAGVENCLQKLGRFSALRYELIDRTSMKKDNGPEQKIVAEIGPQKITAADLDTQIENNIDNQMLSLSQFMSPEQMSEQKKKALEQYKSTKARQQFLRSWLAQEVLYRQALEQGLSDKPQTKRMLDDLTREVLSQQMMDSQLASKIHITDTDLKTYYEVNKSKFTEDVNDPNGGTTKRQKSFDEARQQVAMSLMGDKRRDVQQQYISEMMDKYNVIIHNAALGAGQQDANE
jgi:tetratricopeptide (TPR) repeat protein